MISLDRNDIVITMTMILCTQVAMLVGLISIQDKAMDSKSTYFACAVNQPSKHAYEKFCAFYSPIWIGAFFIIVAFQLYEDFTATTYNIVCLGLALPFFLQPVLYPSVSKLSPDAQRPVWERYATKANLWLAVYSFIGNYW
jgi:cycloeucalenol cycloisomerase